MTPQDKYYVGDTHAHLDHVLGLPYDRLFGEEPPAQWQLDAIPETFDAWSSYREAFHGTYSEAWRHELRRAALHPGLQCVAVRCEAIAASSQGPTSELRLSAHSSRHSEPLEASLRHGTVCLVAASDLSEADIWSALAAQKCGWLLVTSNGAASTRGKGAGHTGATGVAWYLPADIKPKGTVYLARIGCSIPASRALAVLTDPLAGAGLNAPLQQCVLQGLPCSGSSVSLDAVVSDLPSHMRGIVSGLDGSQRAALERAVSHAFDADGGVSLIRGPPGSGKTRTIAKLLQLLIHRSADVTVLQCAATDTALAEVTRQLLRDARPIKSVDQAVLLLDDDEDTFPAELQGFALSGRVSRIVVALRGFANRLGKCCDDAVHAIEKAKAASGASDLTSDIQAATSKVAGCAHSFGDPDPHCEVLLLTQTRQSVRELKKLARESTPNSSTAPGDVSASWQQLLDTARALQAHVEQHISHDTDGGSAGGALRAAIADHYMRSARVLLCTVNRALARDVLQSKVDVVVVDDAQACPEAETIGLFRNGVKALVLVGDPRQPTVVVGSEHAAEASFGRSLFARLEALGVPVDALKTQYRMHPEICSFPSERFYGGALQDSASVRQYAQPWYERYGALRFFTHRRTKQRIDHERGISNEAEAQMVLLFLCSLFSESESSDAEPSVAVVCPSAGQQSLIAGMLKHLPARAQQCVEVVASADSLQGQEREVIVQSLTQTAGSEPTAADDEQQMLVTCTRAKYGLYAFGDHLCFAEDATGNTSSWSQLAQHCKQVGALCPVDADLFGHSSEVKRLYDAFNDLSLGKNAPQRPGTSSTQAVQPLLHSEDHHRWMVLASGKLQHSLPAQDVPAFTRVVNQLKMGVKHFRQPYAKDGGVIGQLFHVTDCAEAKGANKALIWTIEIAKLLQVISLIALVPKGSVAAEWQKFRQATSNLTPEYLEACAAVRSIDGEGTFAPIKYPESFAQRIQVTDNATIAVRGDCKLYDVTESEHLKAFAYRKPLPYLLDETQEQVVHESGAVVVVGRGGTGKTALLSKRLFNCYEAAVAHGSAPPLQLFVSQSAGLVRQVQREFEGFVNASTSSSAARPERPDPAILPVGPHNVAFLSVYELMLALDRLCPESNRTFAEDGQVALPSDDATSADSPAAQRRHTEDSIVDAERFERVYYSGAPTALKRAVPSAEAVFSEIMHVIKRGGDGSATMEATEYVALESPSDLPLTQEARQDLYAFYLKYEKERVRRGHSDMPGVVEHLIAELSASAPKNRAPFDAIYLDEVQDLMPCHWRLLDVLRDNRTHLICSGDQAQAITSGNRFRFAQLKAHMYIARGSQSVAQYRLAINYRTQEPVLALAERVLAVTRFFFPDEVDKTPSEQHSKLAACEAASKPSVLQDAQEGLARLFRGVKKFGAEQVLLVRTREAQRALEERLSKNGWSAPVLTILDAKGLEWDDAVMFDVWSSTGLGDQVRVLLHSCPDDTRPESGIPAFNERKHSGLCRFLKELYVAVTRARHRVMFVESDSKSRKVFEALFDGYIALTSGDKMTTFGQVSTPQAWREKAEQYRDAKRYNEARRAYVEAGDTRNAKRMEALLARREAEAAPTSEAARHLARAAARLYYASQEFQKAGALFLKCDGQQPKVIECLMRGNDLPGLLKAMRRFKREGVFEAGHVAEGKQEYMNQVLFAAAQLAEENKQPDLQLDFLDLCSDDETVARMLEAHHLVERGDALQDPAQKSFASQLLKRYKALLEASDKGESELREGRTVAEGFAGELVLRAHVFFDKGLLRFTHAILAPYEKRMRRNGEVERLLLMVRSALAAHLAPKHVAVPPPRHTSRATFRSYLTTVIRKLLKDYAECLPESAEVVKMVRRCIEEDRESSYVEFMDPNLVTTEQVIGLVWYTAVAIWRQVPYGKASALCSALEALFERLQLCMEFRIYSLDWMRKERTKLFETAGSLLKDSAEKMLAESGGSWSSMVEDEAHESLCGLAAMTYEFMKQPVEALVCWMCLHERPLLESVLRMMEQVWRSKPELARYSVMSDVGYKELAMLLIGQHQFAAHVALDRICESKEKVSACEWLVFGRMRTLASKAVRERASAGGARASGTVTNESLLDCVKEVTQLLPEVRHHAIKARLQAMMNYIQTFPASYPGRTKLGESMGDPDMTQYVCIGLLAGIELACSREQLLDRLDAALEPLLTAEAWAPRPDDYERAFPAIEESVHTVLRSLDFVDDAAEVYDTVFPRDSVYPSLWIRSASWHEHADAVCDVLQSLVDATYGRPKRHLQLLQLVAKWFVLEIYHEVLKLQHDPSYETPRGATLHMFGDGSREQISFFAEQRERLERGQGQGDVVACFDVLQDHLDAIADRCEALSDGESPVSDD